MGRSTLRRHFTLCWKEYVVAARRGPAVIERTATMNEVEFPLEPALPDAAQIAALEQRIQRLEDAVAQLQDTRPIEERVVERVADRINRNRHHPVRNTTGMIIEAGRQLLPAALAPVPEQMPPPEQPAAAKSSVMWAALRWELLVELRAIFRMVVDPRFRLGWPTRILTVVLLVAIATSKFWPPMSMLPDPVATILDKIVDLAFAYMLWKVLIHEA